ncbi:Lrp/AsnC family transcriptional regulator [Acidipropionibacterium virtanenii]|uniref:DNA-binding transcriptional activator DecR n=1 Tax=Acidipropionibacterium virtanenii TaxID=2057246 RepID=A0A344UPX8_9ACTN|nr:Lrp/AsnC family transcriptional regulator [Acidipropionibacterium virtanenii]AXE37326.1 hypothetical protein JS278_00129 [Acidipropionibacterium virtanenii]
MTHDDEVDEIDLRLLHALQIEPRAAWSDLAPIVGADASALSRRWIAMRDSGIAWITGLPQIGRHGRLAFIEVECVAGHREQVATRLEHDPEVLILDYTVGARDLFVTVYCDSIEQMTEYLLGRFDQLPGVRASRTHMVTELISDARSWRLRSLSPSEVARIPRARPPRPRAASNVPEEVRAAVLKELAIEGRMPAATIAARHGLAAQRVADAISTMRARGEMYLRTDISREHSPWPVYTWYFIQLPAAHIDAARSVLRKLPELRLAALCSSRFNLILAVWLPRLEDVHGFEVRLTGILPSAVVADRSAVLRIRKHVGHLLDEHGRATRTVVPVPGS